MIEVTCPSGLRGRIRGMKVKDEKLFTNNKLTRSGRVLSELLKACWVETLDPGPYTSAGDNNLNWDWVLSSDRTFLLIRIRVATYGKDYEFKVTCSNCGNNFGWGVNLEEDIETIPVPPIGVEHVKTGTPIPIKFGGDKTAKCKLSRGEDELFLAQHAAKNQDSVLSYTLARRIAEFEGATRFKDIIVKVEDLEAAEADELWDATDEIEGGVDTSFHVECPQCMDARQVILPFEAAFFSNRKRFAPSRERSNG